MQSVGLQTTGPEAVATTPVGPPAAPGPATSLWYKDAVIYEVHVRAFADSNGDGIGDFAGLTSKLDYLQDLGVTTLWLLPFCPSPLRDDGYDIADYMDIHPSYGTLRDFRRFLREAHKRDLRVITELVVNHTSDQHPWFQRARRAEPGSVWRNFYVWSNTTDHYVDSRVIFKDFEPSNWSWDAVANAHYWHRFYSHQPDLNYDNPEVRKAVIRVLDFWLGLGVDGLRLDAVPYLIERDGTNCENLPETHLVLKELRRHVDARFEDRLMLAEANQWPEDAAAYFGEGDECHMSFHFPVMPRMFMAIRMEDRFPIVDILAQTPPIPESCQWALFLRNHDELTLEMVTDEERDYMYRVYAHDPEARINLGIRRRLAPLLANNRRRIELMNSLLFSLPGTPVVYYGDEIGMGDNIYLGDRNGVRTPMQWSPDRNAGFSHANPQRLYLPAIVDPEYHYETVNVEAQQNNPHSMLWWMKRIIALRRQFKAFGRGTLEFLHPDNRKVLAFVRRYQDETVLVVANLSRFVQFVELNLRDWKGMSPVEMFGHTDFPTIGEDPYFLTLGPHAFYWFSVEPPRADSPPGASVDDSPLARTVYVDEGWEEAATVPGARLLGAVLPRFLQSRRWFGGKGRHVISANVAETIPIPCGSSVAHIALTRVEYTAGDPETYVIPLAHATPEEALRLHDVLRPSLVAHLRRQRDGADLGVLYDAMVNPAFAEALVEAIGRRRTFRGGAGILAGTPIEGFHILPDDAATGDTGQFHSGPGRGTRHYVLGAPSQLEQSNSSFIFGEQLILKVYRRLGDGMNPDLEISRFLTEHGPFPQIAPLGGALEYRRPGGSGQPAQPSTAGADRRRGEPTTIGILQSYVPNEGDVWRLTLDAIRDYSERCTAYPFPVKPPLVSTRGLIDNSAAELPPIAEELIGPYLEVARLLGQRTAQLHLALASDSSDPSFAPEAFSALYQRSLYQSMRTLTDSSFMLLRNRLGVLDPETRDDALGVLSLEQRVLGQFRSATARPINALRIRCHGDYHLGQVLYTGKDCIIVDFEGEPARSISERRIKRTPLRDVAGMLRSFHYAACFGLAAPRSDGEAQRRTASASLEPWVQFWYGWTAATFLRSYLDTLGSSPILPLTRSELEALLDVCLLEKAVYELGYELNNRPSWAHIPLRGIRALVDTGDGADD